MSAILSVASIKKELDAVKQEKNRFPEDGERCVDIPWHSPSCKEQEELFAYLNTLSGQTVLRFQIQTPFTEGNHDLLGTYLKSYPSLKPYPIPVFSGSASNFLGFSTILRKALVNKLFIELDSSWQSSVGAALLVNLVSNNPQLEHLHICEFDSFPNAALMDLSNAILRNPALKKLVFQGYRANRDIVDASSYLTHSRPSLQIELEFDKQEDLVIGSSCSSNMDTVLPLLPSATAVQSSGIPFARTILPAVTDTSPSMSNTGLKSWALKFFKKDKLS